MTSVRNLWTLEEKAIIIKTDCGKRKKFVLNYTYAKCLQAEQKSYLSISYQIVSKEEARNICLATTYFVMRSACSFHLFFSK